MPGPYTFPTHVDDGSETLHASYLNNLQDAVVVLDTYDVGFGHEATGVNGEVLVRAVLPRTLFFPANGVGSYAWAFTAATSGTVANRTYTVQRIPSGSTTPQAVTTIVFGTGAAPAAGVFATVGATTFQAGDTLLLTAPAIADPTLAQMTGVLMLQP